MIVKMQKLMMMRKWHQKLGQLSWQGLPDVGQLVGGFSRLAHGVEVGEEGMGETEQMKEGRREGVGGTWMTKGAVESDGGHAVVGGEVEGGLAPHGPDRYKVCHRGHK